MSLRKPRPVALRLAWFLVGLGIRRRRAVVTALLSLAVFAGLCTALWLEFDGDRDSLVGRERRYHREFLQYKAEFDAEDELVVVVESEDPQKSRLFVDVLGRGLEAEPELFKNVLYRGELRMLGRHGLWLLDGQELKELVDALDGWQPFLLKICATSNLVSFFEAINNMFRAARAGSNGNGEALVRAVPFLGELVQTACLVVDGTIPAMAPGFASLFGTGHESIQQAYITFGGGRIFIVTAVPASAQTRPRAIARLRQLLADTMARVPGVNAELTGQPVLEQEEMEQARLDMLLASVITFVLCALLFIVAYGETGRPLKVALCLALGVIYTLGFTTMVVGHLNILTVTFLPILIGLSIDFGVHLVTRYEEELHRGLRPVRALQKTAVRAAPGVVTGALTTAGAFLAMSLTGFKGIREMGLICGTGMLLCLVPMLVLLPPLLLSGRQNVLDMQLHRYGLRRSRLAVWWEACPTRVLLVAGALTALLAVRIADVGFDYNLLNLQNPHLPAVRAEKKLIQYGSNSVLYCVVIASNATEAAALETRLRQLPSVSRVHSIASVLCEDPGQKPEYIRRISRVAAALRFPDPAQEPVDVPELTRTLWSLQGYLGAAAEEAGQSAPELANMLLALRDRITRLRRTALSIDSGLVSTRLGAMQTELFSELREMFAFLAAQDPEHPPRIDDLPEPLRARFVSRSGRFLLQVFPKFDLWDRSNQRAFITQLRQTLDPLRTGRVVITGTPVQLYEYSTLLRTSYQQAALYATVAILIITWLRFRAPGLVLVSVLPAVLGFVWLMGLMGWAEVNFNLANIMTLPLMVGIGVTTGIQAVVRMLEQRSAAIFSLGTGKAIIVSSLTTAIGFASLIPAGHAGIKSLGVVMTAGVVATMVAGLYVVPALFDVWYLKRSVH